MNAVHIRRSFLLLYLVGLVIVLSACHGVMGAASKTSERVVFSIAWDEPVESGAAYSRSMSQIGESATLLAALYDGATLLEETVLPLADGSSEATVSFSSIPIGLPLTLVASVSAASGLSLYEGSASFTVGLTGITQASLSMKRSPVLVAVNTAGNAYLSNDGSAWLGPYATGLSVANSVSYANGRFIAVGKDGATNGLASSVVGQTWIKQNLDPSAVQLLWVSAAPDGSVMARGMDAGISYKFFHSADGLNWSAPASFTMVTVGPAWFNGEWVICSSNGTNTQKTSDGVAWSAPVSAGGLYQINALIGYGDKIIAGGGAPLNAAKQVNIWNSSITVFSGPVDLIGTTHYINAFALDPTRNRLLAVGSGAGSQAAYSDDYGSSWTVSTGTGGQSFKAAAKWKGGFIIGDAAGQIYKSANGAAFSPAGAATGVEISGIAYNGAP